MSTEPDAHRSGPRLSDRASLLLDGARLAAAQMVLLGHSFDFFGWNSSLHDPGAIQIQRLGVVLFFVLSGFLIPYSVWVKTTDDTAPSARPSSPTRYTFGMFLIDRVSRIYCGLLPALMLIALVDALPFQLFELAYPATTNNSTLWVALANALHFQEYPILAAIDQPIPIFGSGDPLWSLAVEWWIYMLFGVWALRARSLWALLLGAVAIPSVATNLVAGTGDGIALAWLMGWGGFEVWRRLARFPSQRQRSIAIGVAISCSLSAPTAALVWPHRSHFSFDPVFGLLSTAAMIGWPLVLQEREARGNKQPLLWNRLLRAGAHTSFTLYLTHFSLLTVFYEFRQSIPPASMVLIAVVSCNVAAWLIAQLGERHTGRVRALLKRRLCH